MIHLDHLRREHKEVFPYLCSNELISDTEEQPPLTSLIILICTSLSSFDYYKVVAKLWYQYDLWMYLWERYGDPNIPPFPKDLIPSVAVDSSSNEITPPAPVAPTDPILAIDALNSMQ